MMVMSVMQVQLNSSYSANSIKDLS